MGPGVGERDLGRQEVQVVLGVGYFLEFVVERREKARFAFVFEPIAFAFDVDDGGTMREAIESGAWP